MAAVQLGSSRFGGPRALKAAGNRHEAALAVCPLPNSTMCLLSHALSEADDEQSASVGEEV